jgi:hypothetical protein
MLGVKNFPTFYSCVGFQNLSVTSGAAVAFTLPTLTGTMKVRAVQLTVETATPGDSIRIRMDGSAPTTSVGLRFFDGDVLEIDNVDNITNFQAICVGSNAQLMVQYFAGGN